MQNVLADGDGVPPCTPLSVPTDAAVQAVKRSSAPGMNSLDITELDYFAGPVLAGGNQGAGVIVIIDEGGPTADLQLKDGIDLGFCGFPEPRKSTVPQTYTFASSGTARQGELTLFVGSVGEEMPQFDMTASTGEKLCCRSSGSAAQVDLAKLNATAPSNAMETAACLMAICRCCRGVVYESKARIA